MQYRKGNVNAGVRCFINHDMVEKQTRLLSEKIQDTLKTTAMMQSQLDLSFEAQFDPSPFIRSMMAKEERAG